jgi:WD40 repeat protein
MRILATAMLLTGLVAQFACGEEDVAPKTIVIDEAAPELRDVRPRLWNLAFSPDGKSLAVVSGWDNPKEPGELVVWDLASQQPTLIHRQNRPVPCVAFSDNGRLIAIGDFAGTARILDAATGKTLATLPQHQAIINAVAFLPEGKTLVTGCFDGTLTLWDVAGQKERPGLAVPGEQVVGLGVSADGKYIAATTWEGNVHVWDFTSRKLLHKLRAIAQEGASRLGVAQAVAFSPDGSNFVTGSADHSVRLWSTESGKETRSFVGHRAAVQNVAISSDQETLASCDGRGIVMLWNLKTGERLSTLAAHDSACFGLAFSPDGKQLATSSWDRTAKIWDVETRIEVAILERTGSAVNP